MTLAFAEVIANDMAASSLFCKRYKYKASLIFCCLFKPLNSFSCPGIWEILPSKIAPCLFKSRFLISKDCFKLFKLLLTVVFKSEICPSIAKTLGLFKPAPVSSKFFLFKISWLYWFICSLAPLSEFIIDAGINSLLLFTTALLMMETTFNSISFSTTFFSYSEAFSKKSPASDWMSVSLFFVLKDCSSDSTSSNSLVISTNRWLMKSEVLSETKFLSAIASSL